MSRTFQTLDLFALSFLFLTLSECQTGQISPPQNLSLVWIDDFNQELSWAPPQQSVKNCKYEAATETKHKQSLVTTSNATSPWQPGRIMEGGFLHSQVKTVCNGKESTPAVLDISYPELVTNVKCFIYSPKQAHCYWNSSIHARDLRFFYQLDNLNFQDARPASLQECPLYRDTAGMKTGCDLPATIFQTVLIKFNGTVNNTLGRNTFRRELINDVRPPALEWNVTKSGNKFNISWSPPDLLVMSQWEFIINYTECNGNMKSITVKEETSYPRELPSHCRYRIAIKAKSTNGETPWSVKYIDADTGPPALVYAAVIIPLVIAVLAALTFVCCQKNKAYIFPKVPAPRDFLSDISDNNNKSSIRNLYVPAEEEESCKITLVIDPQLSKPVR